MRDKLQVTVATVMGSAAVIVAGVAGLEWMLDGLTARQVAAWVVGTAVVAVSVALFVVFVVRELWAERSGSAHVIKHAEHAQQVRESDREHLVGVAQTMADWHMAQQGLQPWQVEAPKPFDVAGYRAPQQFGSLPARRLEIPIVGGEARRAATLVASTHDELGVVEASLSAVMRVCEMELPTRAGWRGDRSEYGRACKWLLVHGIVEGTTLNGYAWAVGYRERAVRIAWLKQLE